MSAAFKNKILVNERNYYSLIKSKFYFILPLWNINFMHIFFCFFFLLSVLLTIKLIVNKFFLFAYQILYIAWSY